MKNNYLLFLPFHNPWDWHTDYANQTATLLSAHHTVFCFLWGDAVSLREIISGKSLYRPVERRGRLFLYQPLYLVPGKRALSVQFVNLFLNLIAAYILCSIMAFRGKKTLLFWFFGIYDPAFLLLPVFFRYTRTLYDCVDTPSHPDARMTARLEQSEKMILKHAWVVTANSKTLHKRLIKMRKDVHLVPLGFRHEIFDHPIPHKLPFSGKKPVVGYIGAIDYRIDFTLLHRLVTENSRWQFAILGPIFYDHMASKTARLMEQLLINPNVYHTKVPPNRIPAILRQCSVTIIPYRNDLSFNRDAFPMKTMEYLYAKKRVVSSRITELKQYAPYVLSADTLDEWVKAIRHALNTPLTAPQQRKARAAAASHTWKKKIGALLRILNAAPTTA